MDVERLMKLRLVVARVGENETSSGAEMPNDCIEVAFSQGGEMAYGMGLVGGRPTLWHLWDRRNDVASRLFDEAPDRT